MLLALVGSCRPRCPSRSAAPQLLESSLPDPIVAALSKRGCGRVRRVTQVMGSTSTSTVHLRYDTDEGPVFCKRSALPEEIFSAQSTSLRVMRSAALMGGRLRIPEPLGFGSLPLGGSYLLLEWIEGSHVLGLLPSTQEEASPHAQTLMLFFGSPRCLWLSPHLTSIPPMQLGHGLAALHAAPQPPPRRNFGFECDTYLGTTRQDNRWTVSFSRFFIQRRLEPQLDLLISSANPLRVADILQLRERVLGAADLLLRRESLCTSQPQRNSSAALYCAPMRPERYLGMSTQRFHARS